MFTQNKMPESGWGGGLPRCAAAATAALHGAINVMGS